MSSVKQELKNVYQNGGIKAKHDHERKASKDRAREDHFNELLKTDSKELFPIVSNITANLQWPVECQVSEKVKHIYYVPPAPEPYYTHSGEESRPKTLRHKKGTIVYDYSTAAYYSFHRSVCKENMSITSANLCPSENTLKFESRFESGNLTKVVKITDINYELYLRNDLYTYRQKQWFYFRVKNMKNLKYRFSIVNMSKREKLFNEGMKPLMYSVRDAVLKNAGWRRCGENISYTANDETDSLDRSTTYTLSFSIIFPHENDTVYLAYCYPYTYSDLIEDLNKLSRDPVASKYATIRSLCKTVAGNDVFYVTIEDPPRPPTEKHHSKETLLNHKQKKSAIIITARVHAGETPSSWMMKGFLDFLTSESRIAKALRKKFVFQLVPMLNPDGVIVGNTRCSLIGKDLNGEYKNVARERCPSIWYLKLLVERILRKQDITLFCDLHAQYSIHNIYIYGCGNVKGVNCHFQETSFPSILQKNASDMFSFESSKVNNDKARDGTGRVTMWTMGVSNSFTIEASFAGSLLGDRVNTHFSTQDYEKMSYTVCESILEYFGNGPETVKSN